jgi:hypothetical protein
MTVECPIVTSEENEIHELMNETGVEGRSEGFGSK